MLYHTNNYESDLTFLASNTQRLFPSSSIWFHQRSPTNSRPVTFWNRYRRKVSLVEWKKIGVKLMRGPRKQGPGCWKVRGIHSWPLTFTDQKSKESRVMIRTKHGAKFSLIQSQSKYETMANTRKNRWKKEARGCLKSDAQGLQMVKSLRNARKRQEVSTFMYRLWTHKFTSDITEKSIITWMYNRAWLVL